MQSNIVSISVQLGPDGHALLLLRNWTGFKPHCAYQISARRSSLNSALCWRAYRTFFRLRTRENTNSSVLLLRFESGQRPANTNACLAHRADEICRLCGPSRLQRKTAKRVYESEDAHWLIRPSPAREDQLGERAFRRVRGQRPCE